MKKTILKSFISSLIFFGTGLILFGIVKGRNGIIAGNGDKLTYLKWNEMANKIGDVRIKVMSGTMAAAGDTSFAHGLDWTKIYGLNCMISDGTKYMLLNSRRNGPSAVYLGADYKFNNTNIIIHPTPSDTYRFNKPYRCTIFYKE